MNGYYCAECDQTFFNRDIYLNHIHAAEMHTIDEISTLFEDLALEIYFGSNFRHVLMNCSESTISLLQQLVTQAKSDRLGE